MTGYLYRGKPDLEQMNAAIMARRPKDADFTTGRIYAQEKAATAKKKPLPMDNGPPHGTRRRYEWDIRRNIESCDECREAMRAERAAYRASVKARLAVSELPRHLARLEAERLRPTRDEQPQTQDLLDQLIETLATGLFGIRRATNDPGRSVDGRIQRSARLPELRPGSRQPSPADSRLHGSSLA